MKKRNTSFPSLEDLVRSGKKLIEEFDPSAQTYLDRSGRWKKNPESLRDCISNEILYYLWGRQEEERASFLRHVFSPFIGKNFWGKSKKIFTNLQKRAGFDPGLPADDEMYAKQAFLLILEILGGIIACEAFRVNSAMPVPAWDTRGRAQKQEDKKRCEAMTEAIPELSPILNLLHKTAPEFLAALSAMIAEEHRVTRDIHSLLEKAGNREKREEILPMVIEKILPPRGIVTETSPALLRPCLRLLLDKKIAIDSGIPYNASVILSILQDPRSIETMLNALDRFPLDYSKIRENLIYALGSLKEEKAVESMMGVLEVPDEGEFFDGKNERCFFILTEQKKEAIMALGKIGLASLKALPSLIKYAEHPSPELQSPLAWTLGEIGKSQKANFGGVGADIIITLLKLLQVKNKMVFEESVNALKKIDMPEFIHALYLYNVGAVNILGLKPAQKGLYELSETVHFLIREKGRAIVAVNGDSGTGKTYFCQSLKDGFGDIRPDEILYLMRDRKKDQKIFNRILGIQWLKNHIDPIYYHDYPLTEEEDNPEEFFFRFLEENKDKKLILLDGCRDKHYFQRIIDLFYFRGKLDVEVNFRATFSTRRFNLEEREIALESVKTHLSFLEEPALEDTYIYREGKAILYDLDNSISRRLDRKEIQELFGKERIEAWGELIRIGTFNRKTHPLKTGTGRLSCRQEPFTRYSREMEDAPPEPLVHGERIFRMELNADAEKEPNLIGLIDANDLKTKQIRFYAQDQIAGLGDEGKIFILTFLDNRIFFTKEAKSRGITLLGRKIFSVDNAGGCGVINFEKDERLKLARTDSPALVSSGLSNNTVLTGHEDGSIRIWDFANRSVHVLQGHSQPVCALASDYYGKIYSATREGGLRVWDVASSVANVITGFEGKISRIKPFLDKKILVMTDGTDDKHKADRHLANITVMDLDDMAYLTSPSPLNTKLLGASVNVDGRILATYAPADGKRQGSLVIISLGRKSSEFKILDSHTKKTKDCLIMGPKFITCGTEADGRHTLRVWGSDHYVKTELNKLIALADTT